MEELKYVDLLPSTKRFLENLGRLRTREGKAFDAQTYTKLARVFEDPLHYWAEMKSVIVARDYTLEDCVRAVVPNYTDKTTPTGDQLEEAIAYAAS